MVEELFAAVATSSGAAGLASVSVSVFPEGRRDSEVPDRLQPLQDHHPSGRAVEQVPVRGRRMPVYR